MTLKTNFCSNLLRICFLVAESCCRLVLHRERFHGVRLRQNKSRPDKREHMTREAPVDDFGGYRRVSKYYETGES